MEMILLLSQEISSYLLKKNSRSIIKDITQEGDFKKSL